MGEARQGRIGHTSGEVDAYYARLRRQIYLNNDFPPSSNTNDEDTLHSTEDIDDDDDDLPDLESLTEIQEVRHYPLRHRIRHRRRLVLRLRQTRIRLPIGQTSNNC